MSNLNSMMTRLYLWTRREDGQTMAEYGVVLAVITLAVITAFGILATNIDGTIRNVASRIVP